MDINSDDIRVMNKSLALVSNVSITSIDNLTKEARIFRELYDVCLKFLLAKHTWRFSFKRAKLAPSTEKPAFEYAYKYDLPSDFIRIGTKKEQATGQLLFADKRYSVEGRTYYSDLSSLELKYVGLVNANNFESYFELPFIYFLAANACFGITYLQNRSRDLMGQFEVLYRQAASIESQMNPQEEVGQEYDLSIIGTYGVGAIADYNRRVENAGIR